MNWRSLSSSVRKSTLAISFALLLLAGGVAVSPTRAYAINPPTTPAPAAPTGGAATGAACKTDDDCAGTLACLPTGLCGVDPNLDAAPAAAVTPAAPSSTGGLLGAIFHPFATAAGAAAAAGFAYLALFIFGLCASVLGVIGLIFNWIVVYTVFQFGLYFGNSAGLLAGWGILRDVANIVLLFGFIFMGIMTILDVHQFDTRKAIPRLLIFAVLLNFSLFASEAVIDVANVLSASLYQQAGQSSQSTCVTSTGTNSGQTCTQAANGNIQVGISGAIMQASGLTTIWALPSDQLAKIGKNDGTTALILMLLSVFMLVAAVVLGAGAIMLTIRAITLMFLLVLSPVGFAAMAIPQLEAQGKRWWNMLLSQAFFAPVFILLILVSLTVVNSVKGVGGGSFASALGSPSSTTIGILIIFMIVIGFLIGSLMIAKSMGAMGAGFATNAATKFAFGATTLGTNLAVNSSARFARTAIQRSPIKNSSAARMLTKNILTPLEKANLDARRIGPVSAGLSAMGAGAGANASTGLTLGGLEHNYHDYVANENKKDKEYNDQVKMVDLRKELNALENGTLADLKLGDESRKFLSKMTTDQLANMHEIQHGTDAYIQSISKEQYEALLKSDKLNDVQKAAITDSRERLFTAPFDNGMVNDPLTPGGPQISRRKRTLQGMKNAQIAGLADPVIRNANVLNDLNGKQIAGLDPANLETATIQTLQTHLNDPANAAKRVEFDLFLGANAAAARRWGGNMP